MGCFVFRTETKQRPLSRFQAGRQRNRGSFLGNEERSFSFPKTPDRLWEPQTSYTVTTMGRVVTPSRVEAKNEWLYSFTPACTEKLLLLQREFK